MTINPHDNAGDKPLRIRRGRVGCVDLYEIKDSELEILEKGSPATIHLNFSIFLLSIAFSSLMTMLTATFASSRIELIFTVTMIVGFIIGFYLLILWWRTRKYVSRVTATIRDRIPPDDARVPPPPPPSHDVVIDQVEPSEPKG